MDAYRQGWRQGWMQRYMKEYFGNNGNVLYLVCGNDSQDIYNCQNSSIHIAWINAVNCT